MFLIDYHYLNERISLARSKGNNNTSEKRKCINVDSLQFSYNRKGELAFFLLTRKLNPNRATLPEKSRRMRGKERRCIYRKMYFNKKCKKHNDSTWRAALLFNTLSRIFVNVVAHFIYNTYIPFWRRAIFLFIKCCKYVKTKWKYTS